MNNPSEYWTDRVECNLGIGERERKDWHHHQHRIRRDQKRMEQPGQNKNKRIRAKISSFSSSSSSSLSLSLFSFGCALRSGEKGAPRDPGLLILLLLADPKAHVTKIQQQRKGDKTSRQNAQSTFLFLFFLRPALPSIWNESVNNV